MSNSRLVDICFVPCSAGGHDAVSFSISQGTWEDKGVWTLPGLWFTRQWNVWSWYLNAVSRNKRNGWTFPWLWIWCFNGKSWGIRIVSWVHFLLSLRTSHLCTSCRKEDCMGQVTLLPRQRETLQMFYKQTVEYFSGWVIYVYHLMANKE